jgi:predicted nucleic acid-binding protein
LFWTDGEGGVTLGVTVLVNGDRSRRAAGDSFLWQSQPRGPGDETVLEAAVNGQADVLVTFNVRDFGSVPSAFGIEVLLPQDAIDRMKL